MSIYLDIYPVKRRLADSAYFRASLFCLGTLAAVACRAPPSCVRLCLHMCERQSVCVCVCVWCHALPVCICMFVCTRGCVCIVVCVCERLLVCPQTHT